jgi:hypothetical protein
VGIARRFLPKEAADGSGGRESCGVVVSEVGTGARRARGAWEGGRGEEDVRCGGGQLAWHGVAHGIGADGSHHAMASTSSRFLHAKFFLSFFRWTFQIFLIAFLISYS